MIIGLLLSLALSASAAEVPFFNRDVKSAKDVGSLNENFRATADAIRKTDLTNGGTIDGTANIDQICFPDGTCQTTAPVAATASSTTVSESLVGTTFTATSGSVCVATVTLTLSATQDIDIWFRGNITNTVISTEKSLSILVNGAYPSGWSNTSVKRHQTISTGDSFGQDQGFRHVIIGATSGQYNVCLVAIVSGGTGKFVDTAYLGMRTGP